MPPTPQVAAPVAHEPPQLTVFPWQSVAVPEHEFAGHAGGQAQVLSAPQTSPDGQLPQAKLSPQEFLTVPHFGVPPSTPQTAGGGGIGHAPHPESLPPQPSETPSQAPGLLQVRGEQPQVFVVALQVTPPAHTGQVIETPQPVSVPHRPAQSAIVGATQAMH